MNFIIITTTGSCGSGNLYSAVVVVYFMMNEIAKGGNGNGLSHEYSDTVKMWAVGI